jgi:hypothetical protein
MQTREASKVNEALTLITYPWLAWPSSHTLDQPVYKEQKNNRLFCVCVLVLTIARKFILGAARSCWRCKPGGNSIWSWENIRRSGKKDFQIYTHIFTTISTVQAYVCVRTIDFRYDPPPPQIWWVPILGNQKEDSPVLLMLLCFFLSIIFYFFLL